MTRSRTLLLITVLGGITLGLASLGAALTSDSAVTAQSASTLPRMSVLK